MFRIAFGAILLWEVQRYLERDWIREYWVYPAYHFPYEWFPWVTPWDGHGMIVHFVVLGVFAFLMMVGLFYRVAALGVFLTFTYVFLLENAVYLNHFYLVSLISLLMILVPAHRKWSLDALIRRDIRTDHAPAWCLVLLQFQFGVVYFFSGLAKLNYDWLVRGEPPRRWLANRQDFPLLGGLFTEPWAPYVAGLAGAALDLAAPFLLLSPRWRPYMFTTLLAFHFVNDRLFRIGIFPWLAIAAATLFLPPDWPRRLGAEFKRRPLPILAGAGVSLLLGMYLHRGVDAVPALIAAVAGALVVWSFRDAGAGDPVAATTGGTFGLPVARRRVLAGFLFAWALVQILVPLRHYLIPGQVNWTEEGHRFAWRMKLRSKTGRVAFYAHDPSTGTRLRIRTDTLLTPRQYSKMAGRPHMIHQFARHVRERLREQLDRDYQIRVVAFARLNFRPPALLIDSTGGRRGAALFRVPPQPVDPPPGRDRLVD